METITEEILEKLEHDIDTLRVQFEQYFLGARKTAPENERTSLQYRIRRLANIHITNYALRFKFQQLVAKFNAYNQYWNRMMQKLESGMLSRDQLKAVLSSGPAVPERKKPKEKPAEEDLKPEKLEQIYQQLVSERKKLNQSANINKEKLEQTLKKQIKTLKEKYKDKKLEIDVVVEGGQAKLKARVKK